MNQIKQEAIRNARIAKESEQRKNDLIVYLAHDLKTPLTSVIGYLTLLRDELQISEELREKIFVNFIR
jgi:two-component system sensor histidine kinase VanS